MPTLKAMVLHLMDNETMNKENVYPRKQPVQERSRLMVEDILEAASLVLLEEGLEAFNTNRVAQVAGVSVGSLYQYFPNKKSLLLQLQEQEVKTTWKVLDSILADVSCPPRERLRSFIYFFFESEAKEYSLRNGLQEAEVYFEKMQEYQELEFIVTKRLSDFLTEILPSNSADIGSKALLIFTVITGIASRVTQQKTTPATLRDWAARCSDMLCGYLEI